MARASSTGTVVGPMARSQGGDLQQAAEPSSLRPGLLTGSKRHDLTFDLTPRSPQCIIQRGKSWQVIFGADGEFESLREPFVDPATVYQSRSWLDDQALAPAHRGDITSCLLRRAACVDDARFVAHPPDGPAFAPSLVPDAGKGRECGAHRPGLDRLRAPHR